MHHPAGAMMDSTEARNLMYDARQVLEHAFATAIDLPIMQAFAVHGGGTLKVDVLGRRARFVAGPSYDALANQVASQFNEFLKRRVVPHNFFLEAYGRCKVTVTRTVARCNAPYSHEATPRTFVVCNVSGKVILRSSVLRVWSSEAWRIEERWPEGYSTSGNS